MQDPDLNANQEYFVKISNAYYLSGLKYKQSRDAGENNQTIKVKGKLPPRRLNT